MGMGGGGSSTSKSHSDIPSFLGGPAQDIVSQWGQLAKGQMGFSPWEQQGWQQMLNATPEMIRSGRQNLGDVQGIVARADPNSQAFKEYYESQAGNLTDAYKMGTAPSEMSQAMGAGAFGGSADAYKRMQNQYGLGANLSQLDTELANRQQQIALQAASALPGLEANLAAPGRLQMQLGQELEQKPMNTLSNYANLIQAFMGPYSGTTQVTKQGK